MVQWLPWFSGPKGRIDGSMVLESPRDSDRVSVIRGIDEALQAKLDRRREEFKGTWHSQVIDKEQAELLQWMQPSLYTEGGVGTSHKVRVVG